MPKGLSGAGEKFSSRVPVGSRDVFFDNDEGRVADRGGVVLVPVLIIIDHHDRQIHVSYQTSHCLDLKHLPITTSTSTQVQVTEAGCSCEHVIFLHHEITIIGCAFIIPCSLSSTSCDA